MYVCRNPGTNLHAAISELAESSAGVAEAQVCLLRIFAVFSQALEGQYLGLLLLSQGARSLFSIESMHVCM